MNLRHKIHKTLRQTAEFNSYISCILSNLPGVISLCLRTICTDRNSVISKCLWSLFYSHLCMIDSWMELVFLFCPIKTPCSCVCLSSPVKLVSAFYIVSRVSLFREVSAWLSNRALTIIINSRTFLVIPYYWYNSYSDSAIYNNFVNCL